MHKVFVPLLPIGCVTLKFLHKYYAWKISYITYSFSKMIYSLNTQDLILQSITTKLYNYFTMFFLL